MKLCNLSRVLVLRGGADKSLARPGGKEATATTLGIYSTYSPRSSKKNHNFIYSRLTQQFILTHSLPAI